MNDEELDALVKRFIERAKEDRQIQANNEAVAVALKGQKLLFEQGARSQSNTFAVRLGLDYENCAKKDAQLASDWEQAAAAITALRAKLTAANARVKTLEGARDRAEQIIIALAAIEPAPVTLDEADALARAALAASLPADPVTNAGCCQPAAMQIMETAPKDGSVILVWYDHDADPYQDPDNPDHLTDYAAWCEGGDFLRGRGYCLACWEPPLFERTDEYGSGFWLPAWWFKEDENEKVAVNPVRWMPLPLNELTAPTSNAGSCQPVQVKPLEPAPAPVRGAVMAEKLKPCPFCGGDDMYFPHGTDPAVIECSGCGARYGVPDDQTEVEATAKWNVRVAPSLRITGPNSDGEYWLHIKAGGLAGGVNLGGERGPICKRLLDAASETGAKE